MHTDTKSTEAIIIFVKNAELGKVKTRLASQIGDERALEIYQLLLQHTQSAIAPLDADVRIYYSDYLPEIDLWDLSVHTKHLQEGSNLGDRLIHALDESFRLGYHKIVVIGSDCPQLSASHIEKAFMELEDVEVVLGPARDGGYYLIAMNRLHEHLFQDKHWSSEELFDQTIDDLIQHKLSWFELPILSDIDTVEDLERTSFAEATKLLV
jgi:rSAM/selenodomain-associated transferase 1